MAKKKSNGTKAKRENKLGGETISKDGLTWELPVTEKTRLIGLNSADYEHPLDRQALSALESTPGLERVMSQLLGGTVERVIRIQLMAGGIRVTDKNFPDLNKAYHETCEILDVDKADRPQIYISDHEFANAFAAGSDNPMIAFKPGIVGKMGTDELRYVIGRELGHIKSKHGLYRMTVELFKLLSKATTLRLGILPLVAFGGVYVALMKWSRMAEFTCDRAGLLACQNLDAAIRANIKMAGLPQKLQNRDVVKEFIQQARDFEAFDYVAWDRIFKEFLLLEQEQPWTVIRAKELLSWNDSGQYERIITQCKERIETPVQSGSAFCPYCGMSLKDKDAFCGKCGAKVDQAAETTA